MSVMSGEYHPDKSSNDETTCCGVVTSTRCADTVSSILSTLGILFLVLMYTLAGALIFMSLESTNKNNTFSLDISTKPMTFNKNVTTTAPPSSIPAPNNAVTQHRDEKLRSLTVEKLWKITEDLNILYKENWTKLAEKEMIKFEKDLLKKYNIHGGGGGGAGGNGLHIWNFPNSFLYSLTLITTIGYGTVSAKTLWGRIITILYTLVGIPLMLIYLSIIGETLANHFRCIYGKLTKQTNRNKKNKPSTVPHIYSEFNHVGDLGTSKYDNGSVAGNSYCTHSCDFVPKIRIPIILSFSIIISFILLGSLIFNKLENWTFLDGTFFCFTSLGTIGFGELIPGENFDEKSTNSKNISVLVSSSYILIGMAVISMCFNLIQEELIFIIKKYTNKMNKNGKTASGGGGTCNKNCNIS